MAAKITEGSGKKVRCKDFATVCRASHPTVLRNNECWKCWAIAAVTGRLSDGRYGVGLHRPGCHVTYNRSRLTMGSLASTVIVLQYSVPAGVSIESQIAINRTYHSVYWHGYVKDARTD
jgi:hypothetical protein